MPYLPLLGVHGLDGIEDAIIAALVTGDPLLLVGRHGSAKTLLAARVACELGLSFHAYDASKALFEDVLGFPDPRGLAEGRLDYVPTPISIWDKEFILVDELSRATPNLQSKWLEVVRSRRLMGKAVPNLSHVWAAMNPPDYLGAQPLDDALLGRFAWVLRVPEAHELAPDALRAVIETVGDDDAPAMGRSPRRCGASGLGDVVRSARLQIPAVEASIGPRTTAYLAAVATAMRLSRVSLDGRRLGFLRRNALALAAVRALQGGPAALEPERLETTLLEALRWGVPFAAEERPPGEHVVLGTHRTAWRLMSGRDGSLQARTIVMSARGPLAVARACVEHAAALQPTDRPDVVSRIEDDLHAARDPRTVAEAVVALRVLLAAPGTLRGDAARRAATLYVSLTNRPMYHHPDRRERQRPPEASFARELGRRVAGNLRMLEHEPPLDLEGEHRVAALSDAFETLLGVREPS